MFNLHHEADIRVFHSLIPNPATQETVETSSSDSEFVEVGYISSVHGLQGEVRVKPSTDFPDLRFSKVEKQPRSHLIV